jgi:hypothetical protein
MRCALAVFAFALAACVGDPPDAPAPAPADELVNPPLFQAAYRVDAQMFPEDGGQGLPLVMVRDGARTRMEITTPASGRVVIITAGGDSFVIRETLGQYDVIRIPPEAAPQAPDVAWSGAGVRARRTGDCRVADENGTLYESTDAAAGQRGVACITADGVMLEAYENGRLVWRASRVLRGPQDPEQFALPAGAAVLDAAAVAAGADGALEQLRQR